MEQTVYERGSMSSMISVMPGQVPEDSTSLGAPLGSGYKSLNKI